MAAGARSTEFWLAAGGVLAGLALTVAGVILGRDVAIAAGAVQQAAVAIGYAHSRGKTKAPRPYLPPTGRL